LGAAALRKEGAAALVSGDIVSGRIYTINYDGTNFQVSSTANPTFASVSVTGALSVTGVLTASTAIVTPLIRDTFGNEMLGFVAAGSAVNYLQVTNRAAGFSPIFTAVGDDTNIGIDFVTKGTGAFSFSGNINQTSPSVTLNDVTFTTPTAAPFALAANRYVANGFYYAVTDVIVDDNTSGSEDATYGIWAAIAGAFTKIAQFAATITFNRVVSATSGLIGLTTANQAFTNGTAGSVAHGLGRKPFMIQCIAECTTNDDQYVIGDELVISSTGSQSSSVNVNPGIAIYTTDTTNIRWRVSDDGIFAIRKTSGEGFTLTAASWRLKFKYL
jgi:hypothetical protein